MMLECTCIPFSHLMENVTYPHNSCHVFQALSYYPPCFWNLLEKEPYNSNLKTPCISACQVAVRIYCNATCFFSSALWPSEGKLRFHVKSSQHHGISMCHQGGSHPSESNSLSCSGDRWPIQHLWRNRWDSFCNMEFTKTKGWCQCVKKGSCAFW